MQRQGALLMTNLLAGRRVLVVEDEMLVMMMIEGMLADRGCERCVHTRTPSLPGRGPGRAVISLNVGAPASVMLRGPSWRVRKDLHGRGLRDPPGHARLDGRADRVHPVARHPRDTLVRYPG